MANGRDTELVIRAKNLTNDAFGAASGNIEKLGKKAKDASSSSENSFGKMEKGLRQFDDVLELAGGPHLRDLIQGVGQLGDVATGTSGELTGLAKAGLVASAAFGGWQIGRKIAELSGSDTIIGNATAKLLGWGDAAGEVAAAKADLLAKASKNAGRQITDLNEAVKINEQVTTKAVNAMSQLHAPAESVKVLGQWRAELDKLKSSGVLDGLRKDIESQNFSQKDLSDRYHISTDAVQLFSKEIDKQQKATEKANKTTEEHTKKIKELSESYSGAAVLEKAADALEALHLSQKNGIGITQMSIDQQKALGDAVLGAIDVYTRLGQAVPPELQAVAFATRAMTESQKKDIEAVTKALADMEKGILQLPGIMPGLKTNLDDLASRDLRKLNLTPGDNKASQDARSNLIHDLGRPSLVTQLFGSSEQMGQALSASILGAIQGGGNPASAAAGMVGSKVASHIATSLTDKGSKLFQTALGGVLNSALPVIGALAGPLLDKLWGSLFGTKGRDTKLDLARQFFGSPEEMQRQMVETLSKVDYDRLWKQFSEVGQNNKGQAVAALDAIRDAMAKAGKQAKDTADTTAAAADKISSKITGIMGSDELDALHKGFASAQADGFKGAESEFLQQQLKFYDTLEEGDARLKTYFAGTTIDAFHLIASGQDELAKSLTDRIKGISTEMQGLMEQVGQEAEEAEMGVVERQQRERIEQLRNEKKDAEASLHDAAQQAVASAAEAAKTAGEQTADAIEDALKSRDFTIHVRALVDTESGEMPQHAAGAYIREDHTARVHAGEMIGGPDFFAAALARAMAANGAGSTASAQPINIQVDGKTIAYVSMKYRGQVLAPMGR